MILETKAQRENFLLTAAAVLFVGAVMHFFVFMWWLTNQNTPSIETSWVSQHNFWQVYPTGILWLTVVVGSIATLIAVVCGGAMLGQKWVDSGADITRQEAKESLITDLGKR